MLFIKQSKYALESLKKYDFESCDLVDNLMVEKSKLGEDKEGKAIDPSHYRGMISTLLYLTASRPVLQFAICMCDRYQARPTEKHIHAIKRIFQYLRGTVNQDLWYSKDSFVALIDFEDVDHAGCQDTRRIRKLNKLPYLDVVLKSYGCDLNLRTMALDSTKFQCTAIIKVLLPYAAIMSNTLGLSISTSYTISSRSRHGLLHDHEKACVYFATQPMLSIFHECALQCAYAMDTTIEQKVAMDEALVPHAQRLRIGRRNFLLLSDIKSKESTLQLVYDVMRICPFFKDFLVTADNTQQFGAMLTIKLTNEEIRNSNAYKEYYAIATGAAPPKPKASVWKTRSSLDTSITPLTVTHISQASGFGADEGTDSIPRVPDVPTDESKEELSWNSTDDEGDDDEEDEGDDAKEGNGDDDKDDDGEEGDDDDDDQVVKKDDDKEGGDDKGNGKEDLGLNVGREEGHIEEKEEDELYRDVNINQGRGIQVTQEVEDSHVTLTLVNLDGQQQSSSVSSQFVTSMLNLTIDAGMEQTNPFAEAVSAIPRVVHRYMDQQINEAVKVAVQIQSDNLRNATQKENDEFLRTIDENIKKIIKEQVKEQVQDEKPSAGPDRGLKRRKEGKEPESASASIETATRSAGRATLGSRSRQASTRKFAIAEEPMQTIFQMDDLTHPEFDIGANDQPIVQSSQHPEWFPQQQKPPTPDRD
nr:uncharacterized mitochondrial protein AtMg00810-like [Tanacetum cinerariifolium]